MLKLYVDFNAFDVDADGRRAYGVRLDGPNSSIAEPDLCVGMRVELDDDESMSCEAILGHGEYHKWVGTIIEDTIKHYVKHRGYLTVSEGTVYDKPSYAAQVVGTVQPNAEIAIIVTSGEWVRVYVDGMRRDGWMHSRQLRADPPPP